MSTKYKHHIHGMVVAPNGQYVHIHDYKQLQAEVTSKDQEITALSELIAQAAKTFARDNKIIIDLQAELDKHRWIPVSERLPEVKKVVWVMDYRRNTWQAELLIGKQFYSEETQHELYEVTHWKPITLPE